MAPTVETVLSSLTEAGVEVAARVEGSKPNSPREDVYRIQDAIADAAARAERAAVADAAARAERAAVADAAARAERAGANTSDLIIQRSHEPLFLEKAQRTSFLSQISVFSVSFYSNFF